MTSGALTDFKLAGNPTTNAARLKAMAHGGPLVIAHDHWLSAMMPDALADAAEGGKTVCMADLDEMVLDSMLIDSDVAIKGVHFGILPARYKQLLIDVGSSGNMDWSPVHGDIGEVLPVVKSRFIPVIKALSEEMYALPDAYGMRLREVPVRRRRSPSWPTCSPSPRMFTMVTSSTPRRAAGRIST